MPKTGLGICLQHNRGDLHTVNDWGAGSKGQQRDRNLPIGEIAKLPDGGGAKGLAGLNIAILACVWVLALLYLALYLKRGWVPHDEGTFAQSAERVLRGELPHRDFIDNYTGGLTFLNALAFRIFGVNLASLRILLFTFFAFWVPCVFYIASRFVSGFTAGSITLLAVAWGVPNYPCGVPSWYNLFFAVFGICALLRYMEAGSRRWLFIAGLCGGFSILIKITGTYFITAATLFLIFREQNLARVSDGKPSRAGWLFRTFIGTGLIVFVISLTRLVDKVQGVRGVIYFVMPSAFLAGLLLYREFAESRGSDKIRFLNMYSMFAPFAAGIAIPILAFLIPYGLSHSTGALVHDLFNGSEKQLLFAVTPAPGSLLMMAALPVIGFVIGALVSHQQGQRVYGTLLLFYLSAILVLSSRSQMAYAQGWCSIAFAIPAIALGGAAMMGSPQLAQRITDFRQEQIMLLLAAMAVISLVQFPFSVPVYFCYVAPLAILAVAALCASLERPPRLVFGILIVFYLVFAVVRVTPGFDLGSLRHVANKKTERLTLARAANLRVDPREARVYEVLIPAIQSHADGDFIYAAPDSPEVYFLSGLHNPTRTIFDFRDDLPGRKERILRALENHGVNVIAIKSDPQFSKPLEPELMEVFETLYPNSEEIGNFELRWKSKLPPEE
jgi:Dolichyl-phosphate-mannose-protein mannosyltransferase